MNMKLLQPVQHTPRCSKYKHIPYTYIETKLGKFLENGLVIRVGVEKILKKNFEKKFYKNGVMLNASMYAFYARVCGLVVRLPVVFFFIIR